MTIFADYIADALASHIASDPEIHDLIMRTNRPDQILYVDIEEQAMFLITIQPAVAVAEAT